MNFKGPKRSLQGLDDYDVYRLSGRETLLALGLSFSVLALLMYVFFDAVLFAFLPEVPLVIFGAKYLRRHLARRRKARLKKQFLSAVTMFGDALKSGQSAENALLSSVEELTEIYGAESDIVREWKDLDKAFRLNKTPEEMLKDFGERSKVDEIRDFAEIFAVTKRSGGKLSEVVESTATLLSEEFAVEEKIRTMTSAKKLEQKIMDLMPIGILLYIRLASPEIVSVLYEGAAGRLIMAICLALYVFSALWAEKLIAIRM